MKTFILFLLLATLLPYQEGMQKFTNEISEGYEEYIVLYGETEEEATNSYYTLKIVKGINDNQVTYGFYLYNDQSRSHTVVITANGKNYYPKTDSRGDYYYPAIELKTDNTLQVYDENDKVRYEVTIVQESKESFLGRDLLILGNNQGIEVTQLSGLQKISLVSLLQIIFGSFVFLFGIVLLIMFVSKKGLFNKEKRQENVFDFNAFINEINSQKPIIIEDEPLKDHDDDVPLDAQIPVNNYPNIREYEDEEDDISDLIIRAGFSTDYMHMTEEKKDEIMLYLMRIRDEGKITSEQYRQEVIKLWKK